MPEGLIENKWDTAKTLFTKSYGYKPLNEKDWAIVMEIYKKICGNMNKEAITKNDTYSYVSEIEPMVITKKGKDKYYIEGYISTIDEDLANEVVTMEAQKDMLNQIKGRTITLDAEHETFYEKDGTPIDRPKSIIPLGKIIDAELRSKGVWVKAEINTSAPRFKNVWGSIEKGMLNAFSVAFYPIEKVKKKIGDVMKSFVNKLNLINITLTGSPCNPNAKFTPVMKTILKDIDNTTNEVNKMKNVSVKAEEKSKETDEPKEEIVDEKQTETKTEEKEESKDEPKEESKEEVDDESKEEVNDEPEKKTSEDLELKTELKSLKDKIEELKEEIKVLKTKPKMKAIVEEPKIDKKNSELKEFNALSFIR
jgi:hypothetical protein